MEPLQQIANGIASLGQKLGIVSTSSLEGKPESAVVYFGHGENLDIYFTTRSDSRKYKNITENPHVAFVIYTEQPPKTIQIEGLATEVTDPHDQTVLFSEVVALANENNPQPPIDQLSEKRIVFIKISTAWARMGNFEIERKGEVFTEVTKG